MEILEQPPWALSVRLVDDNFEFSLGDGRRLASLVRQPADHLYKTERPTAAAQVLGKELAARLAVSAPRALNLQLDEKLEDFDWESLVLGGVCLAEHFAVARQLMSDAGPTPAPDRSLAEALKLVVLYGVDSCAIPDAQRLALDSLGKPEARDAVMAAHVLVLDGVTLTQLLEHVTLPRRERLLVLKGPQPAAQLTAAVDHGAAILDLPSGLDLVQPLQSLSVQLGSGASVGEATRRLHRRALRALSSPRLYGDSAMRFVRAQPPASRRQVTSLSFDLVGSTSVLRQLGDEAYAEMLASLHQRCTDIVRRHGGLPGDPQGKDSVMSYFGHPTAVENAAEHAVLAGLQVVRAVSELGVSLRVGVATGLVAVRAGQPVGLSIHLAARLQEVAAPGTLLVSEATRHLVAHAFELQALEATPVLKGIETKETLYVVLGPSHFNGIHRLERSPLMTPFVGRKTELARLDDCWRQIHVGECRVALVRAEAGMGKSRLVREFRAQLVAAGVKVLECRCRPDASASPYLALSEALRHWAGVGSLESDPEALQRLAEALPGPAGDDDERTALLGVLLGLSTHPSQPAPDRLRQRMLALLLDWFDAFAKDQRCCLIVEDWHWVDPSMREFVERLADRSGGPGLLVVLTMRGEADSVLPKFQRPELIDLFGLPPASACELVRRVCAQAPLAGSVVQMLAERGDGVPLFLEEAARMALELGADRLGADAAGLGTVPASLQDLLMARLDGVGPARSVAQVAAVLGREFSLALLAGLLEAGQFALDASSLTEHLAALETSGLVRCVGGGQYAFKHALVRDTAYASLWVRDRQALHAEVAGLLQTRWPELAKRRPELLAHHQSEAELHVEALAQWELAARNATARSALREATSHLRRALAVLARLDSGPERDRTALRLQLLLAARLIATEGYGAEVVSRAYLDAGRLCDTLGDETERFKIEMGLEAYRFMRADFSPALDHGRRAAAIAASSGDNRQRLHAHWGLACTLFHQGELRTAMAEMETGLALYTPALHRSFGVQDPGVMCLAYSSWGLWELGRPDTALARINRAVSLAAEHEHKFSQAVTLAYCASIHLLRGEPDAAINRAESCMQVCEESGFPVWLAIARCMRGRVLCGRGEFDLGLAEMRAGYAQWLSTGAMVSRPLYLSLQAEGLALAGQIDAAVSCVDEGLGIVDRYGERQLEAELRRLRGELALQAGDSKQAEAWLRSAYATALRQRRMGFALRSASALARLWVADGRQSRARRLLVPLVMRWSEGLETRDLRVALAQCASLE